MAQPKLDETRVIRMTRTFDAPRERVFRAWTEPEQLVKWWGPKGFTVPDHSIDVRPGGAWRTTMRSPEGNDHIVAGIYHEITPPERLVFTWGWETEGPRGHETLVTIELHEREGGTELQLTQELFESETSRDMHHQGWSSCMESLDDALREAVV